MCAHNDIARGPGNKIVSGGLVGFCVQTCFLSIEQNMAKMPSTENQKYLPKTNNLIHFLPHSLSQSTGWNFSHRLRVWELRLPTKNRVKQLLEKGVEKSESHTERKQLGIGAYIASFAYCLRG